MTTTTTTTLVPNSCYKPAWMLRPGVAPLPAFVVATKTTRPAVEVEVVDDELDAETAAWLAELAAGERAFKAAR